MLYEDYIGNQKVKNQVLISIASSKKRKEPLKHMLLSGPPGLGKTSLAKLISNMLSANLITVECASIKDTKDFLAIVRNFSKTSHNILFFDEVHELSLKAQEIIGIAMESKEVAINNGYFNKTVKIPPVTVIAATTIAGALSKPFLDRFGMQLIFDFYPIEDCVTIVERYIQSQQLNLQLLPDASMCIAKRGRGTPRILKKLADNVIDFCIVNSLQEITVDVVNTVMNYFDIDEAGLNKTDLKILNTLYTAGRPVGIENLAAVCGEDAKTLASSIEPYLMRIGFVTRTPKGRLLTGEGYEYLMGAKQRKKALPNIQEAQNIEE